MPCWGRFKSKTPAFVTFYKIVVTIKSTKLVYNFVFSRTGITGTISYFRMTLMRGVGPQGAGVGPWIVDLG